MDVIKTKIQLEPEVYNKVRLVLIASTPGQERNGRADLLLVPLCKPLLRFLQGMISAFRTTIAKDGAGALLTGLGPTVVRVLSTLLDPFASEIERALSSSN